MNQGRISRLPIHVQHSQTVVHIRPSGGRLQTPPETDNGRIGLSHFAQNHSEAVISVGIVRVLSDSVAIGRGGAAREWSRDSVSWTVYALI